MMETKENTPVQEKDRVRHSKSKLNWEKASYMATVFNSISVIIAVVTLVVGMYPQLIWRNSNYLERANAGDVYSQMFLAEHYYEIGEYADSIYWYKLASVNSGEYQGVACNNLALIYAEGYGLPNYEENGYLRYEKALKLFQRAENLGLSVAHDNIVYLLGTHTEEHFPESNYNDLLVMYDTSTRFYSHSVGYISTETYKGAKFSLDGVMYSYSGSYTADSGNGYTTTIYKYYGYEIIETVPMPDPQMYQFIQFEDLY